jgi:hypothetical protein
LPSKLIQPVHAITTGIGNIDTTPEGLAQNLFNLIMGAAGALAVIKILTAGWKIMFSGGDPRNVQEGKEELISAVQGLLLVLLAVVIIRAIEAIFGIDI